MEKNDKSRFVFSKENFKLLIIGVGIVCLGFLLMMGGASEDPANVFNGEELFSFRRITLAPIVVLGGYAFVFYAIMKKTDTADNEPNA